jgi:hypothetical protein
LLAMRCDAGRGLEPPPKWGLKAPLYIC